MSDRVEVAQAVDRSAIDARVHHLFALVADGIAAATTAFLGSDRNAASALIAADRQVDALQREIESLVEKELLRDVPRSPEDIAALLLALRIVPELERSGDLVEHIALRTRPALAASLSPRARLLVDSMGRVATEMWRVAEQAYGLRDASAADRLRRADDELDDLHVSLTAELSAGILPTAVAIELGLIARFFERLGDHAVNVSRRFGDQSPVDEQVEA
jgi:phosphate transport system protein